MAENQPRYIVPILSRPVPLEIVIAPVDRNQPSVIAKCGHPMWRKECLILKGTTLRESTPRFSQLVALLPAWLRRFFAPKQCSLCHGDDMLKAAIRCAYCEEVIFPGDPVSTYFPVEKLPEGFEARATRTRNGFVGCMRMDCCPSGDFFAGHWILEGIQSPFSTGVAASEAFREGKAITISVGPLR